MTTPKVIKIDEQEYVLKSDLAPPPKGKRCVIIVDRGWIFAGDIEDKDGRIKITRAVHVFSWSGIGFAAMLALPKGKVDIRLLGHDVDLPSDAELFRIPVSDTWGL